MTAPDSTRGEPGAARLDWMLDDVVKRLAGVRHAAVLSTDGLVLGASSGLSPEQSEYLCAMSSALYSLAKSASSRYDAGAVRQTVVELDDALLFLTAAGANACLTLLAGHTANLGIVAYEVNQTVQRVGSYLATNPRHIETVQAGARRS